MSKSFLVDLIVKCEALWEIADLPEFVSNASQFRNVIVVIAPECDALVLLSHRENSTIYKVVALFVEKPANHVQDK